MVTGAYPLLVTNILPKNSCNRLHNYLASWDSVVWKYALLLHDIPSCSIHLCHSNIYKQCRSRSHAHLTSRSDERTFQRHSNQIYPPGSCRPDIPGTYKVLYGVLDIITQVKVKSSYIYLSKSKSLATKTYMIKSRK